jgi:hypothetical protein
MREKDLKEDLATLAYKAEADHEVQMARADLYKIAKYSIKLHEMLKGVTEEQGIEGWVQSKITKAADYMGSVYHHLDYEMKFDEMTEAKKAKPDFRDVDGDKDEDESWKKAEKDKKAKEKKKVGEAKNGYMEGYQKYHCKDCGCQMHNCKSDCDCKHDSHDETGSWWRDKNGNGVPDVMESYTESLAKRLEEAKKKKGLHYKESVCSDCGNPSYTTLPEEKQKGVDGKVCWKGYKRMGTKKKGGKTVDNCVKM